MAHLLPECSSDGEYQRRRRGIMATPHHALLIDGELSTRDVVRRHLAAVCDVTCVASGHQAHLVLERAAIASRRQPRALPGDRRSTPVM